MLPYIFKSVLIYSLTGTIGFLLLGLLRPLTKRLFSSRWHYYVSVALLISMLIPVRIAVPKVSQPSSAVTLEKSETQKCLSVNAEAVSPEKAGAAEEKQEQSDLYRGGLLSLMSGLWLITGAGIFIFKSLSYKSFIRKVKRSSERIFADGRRCRVIKTRMAVSPMVAGVLRPMIILPNVPLSREDMQNILSHENIHLRRRDVMLKWLILLTKCIHWFNPFVYIMAKQANTECEISCDLAATRGMSMGEKKSYASTVLRLAVRTGDSLPDLVSPMSSQAENMKRRFIKIKTGEKISKKARILSFSVAALLAMSTLFISGAAVGSMEKPERETNELFPTETEQTLVSDTEKETEKRTKAEIYTLPCDGGVITDKFKMGKHEGIDISGNRGDPVYACEDGKILFAGIDEENPSDGITIVLAGSDGTVFRYLHLGALNIFATGQLVKAGQIIGKIGSTGLSTGNHIHLEVQREGRNIDPSSVF